MECNKNYKAGRGIKIHLAKSKCGAKKREREEREQQEKENLSPHCSPKGQKSEGEPLPGAQPQSRGIPAEKDEKLNAPKEEGMGFIKYKQPTLLDMKYQRCKKQQKEFNPKKERVECEGVRTPPAQDQTEKLTESTANHRCNKQQNVLNRNKNERVKSEEVRTPPAQEQSVPEKSTECIKFVLDRRTSNQLLEVMRDVAGRENETIADHHIKVTRADVGTLRQGKWCNTTIIDAYMELLVKRSKKNTNLQQIQTVSAYFYMKLMEAGEVTPDLERWVGEDMMCNDIVLFPVLWSHHWSLVVFEVNTGEIQYMDSLPYSRIHSTIPDNIREFLVLFLQKRNIRKRLIVNRRTDAPIQHNGYDCGPFVCQYAERMTRKKEINFNQKDISYFRMKIVSDIMKGEIQEDSRENKRIVEKENTDKKLSQPEQKTEVKQKSTSKADTVRKTEVKEAQEPKTLNGKRQNKNVKVSGKEERRENDRKARINWPKAQSKEWEKLDTDLVPILENLKGSPQHKMDTYPELMYTFCKERFGIEEKRGKKVTTGGPST